VGADANETVSITSISSARTAAIGGSFSSSATSTTGVSATAFDGSSDTLNGIAVTASVSDGVSWVGGTYSAKAKASAINATSGTGVTATASTTVAGQSATGTTAVSGTLTINGQDATIAVLVGDDAAASAAKVVSSINAISGATGVTASVANTDQVEFSSADGRNITLEIKSAGATAMTAANLGISATVNAQDTEVTFTGKLALSSTSSSGITVDDDASAVVMGFANKAGMDQTATGSGVAISVASVATVSGANETITAVDNALSTISSIRSDLGSYQSRFESVVANLQTTSENLSASRSRIVDADFAAETANLTKAQILQQSGIAMLAQANAIPQNVLALLQ
jgi:flagellin